MRPAHLRQVEARNGAEFDTQGLEEDGEEVGEQDHEEQLEAVRGAGGDVGGVVAGVDVGDGDEEAGTDEGEVLA